MAIPWPDEIWIRVQEAQLVPVGQVIRRRLGAPPHNTQDPVWRFSTTLAADSKRDVSRFLNSLGGASQVVELPMARPASEGFAFENEILAEDGDWAVNNVSLTGRHTQVAIDQRAGVGDPPVSALVRVGTPTFTRLYEVDESAGGVLLLNPRVSPPTGTTVLRGAKTVSVRLDTSINPVWGVRDIRIPGGYVGASVAWIEAGGP